MSLSTGELPTNTCSYDRFDPETLEPLNPDTYVRLQELGWTAEEFQGKSVLDIGSNSGLLTMHALSLGAAQVHACEVQDELADFLAGVAERQKLPVVVSRRPFHQLTPEEHKADVVLFMEVLHWAVAQGLDLRDSIRSLADLTGETLYVETPWSVAEPSIQAQTSLTESDYSADAALDELTKYFTDVRVVRFMHYFGFNTRSKRVLIRARGKRPEAELLARLPDTYSLDSSLAGGRNESYLLSSPRGTLVGKLVAATSHLPHLPADLRREMFDRLHEAEMRAIVPPERLGDDYVASVTDGRTFMVFPFVGTSLTGVPQAFKHSTDDLIELFAAVRADLRVVGDEVVEKLREEGVCVRVDDHVGPDALWLSGAEQYLPADDLSAVMNSGATVPLDSLNHRDLQLGNVLTDADGRPRVIDLDTIGVGSVYSDGILGLIWRAASESDLERLCATMGQDERRAVQRGDVIVALANGLGWFHVIRRFDENPVIKGQIERFASGVEAALRFHDTLPG